MYSKKITVVLLSVMLLLSISCVRNDSENKVSKKSEKIVKANITKLKETAHGSLGVAGEGEDKTYLLTLWGTPYEMGKAYGELLKNEILSYINHIIKLRSQISGQPVNALDKIYEVAKPYIAQYYLDEMKGIAEGSGMSYQAVIRGNMIGEAGVWNCSLFGAWGKATAADGHLYQLRSLDYETKANIQKYPVVVVYVPDEGHPFANISWAGVVGCVSGISKKRLAISQIGDDYDKANDTPAGIPFMFLLRDVLQFDNSLDDAIMRIKKAKRTRSIIYGIGDGELGYLRGFQTSHTLCNVFNWDNLEPLTPTHQRIEDIVYWGMSWDVPSYDGPLHDKLVEYYGHINAEVTINDIVTSVGTGDLQTVVYDLTAMKIWVANAKADDEHGPLAAYDRQFIEFDMNKVFSDAEKMAEKIAPHLRRVAMTGFFRFINLIAQFRRLIVNDISRSME